MLLPSPALLHFRVASLSESLHTEVVEAFERFDLLHDCLFLALVDLLKLFLLRLELFLASDELVNELINLAVLGQGTKIGFLRIHLLISGLGVNLSEQVCDLNV